jgi:predicted MFS family arabinose efflux permease
VAVEFRDGVRHLWRRPLLRGQLVVATGYFAGNGALTALLVPYISGKLGGSSQQLGLVLSALGLGFMVGAPLSGRVVDRIPPRTATAGTLALVSLCFFGMFNVGNLVLVTVLAGLAGVPAVVLLVGFQTQVQRSTPDALLGRVSAAFGTAEMTATVAGSAGAATAAAAIGLTAALNTAIALIAAAAVAALILFPVGGRPQPDVGSASADLAGR